VQFRSHQSTTLNYCTPTACSEYRCPSGNVNMAVWKPEVHFRKVVCRIVLFPITSNQGPKCNTAPRNLRWRNLWFVNKTFVRFMQNDWRPTKQLVNYGAEQCAQRYECVLVLCEPEIFYTGSTPKPLSVLFRDRRGSTGLACGMSM